MYKESGPKDTIRNFSFFVEALKIGIVILLLLLGIHIVLWAIDNVDNIINNPESVSLLKVFMGLESNQQIINVALNGKNLTIMSNEVTKWLVLLLLFIVLFNVIGKAIIAILSSMSNILMNINFNKLRVERATLDINEEYVCEHCNTPYNPSDYRRGATLRCDHCHKAIKPPF